MDNQVDTLATAVRHMRYAACADVSSLALLVYDYALTFSDETALMWPARWSPAKIMFFLTRYLPFVDTSIIIWQASTSQLSGRSCAFAYQATPWMLDLGICGAEVILAVRTWAVFGFSRTIGLFLIISGSLTMIPLIVLAGITVHSLHCKYSCRQDTTGAPIELISSWYWDTVAPLPGNLPGCLISSAGKSYITYSWMLLAVFEGIVLALMSIKAFKAYKVQGHTYVYRKVYADGSLFYVYLFVLSIANLVVVLKRPLGLTNLLSSIERVIHSILTGRILMELRKIAIGAHHENTNADASFDWKVESSIGEEVELVDTGSARSQSVRLSDEGAGS